LKNNLIGFLFAIGVLLLPAIGYCNPFSYFVGSSESWKEEVKLHDGRVLVVDRHVTYSARSIDVGRQELNESLTFTLPNPDKEVIWKSDKEVVWKSDFNKFSDDPYGMLSILLVDIVNNTPYIAARPVGCMGFNKWKRLNPPYIIFKHDGSKWQRIPLEEFPVELSKTNVIVGGPSEGSNNSFYTQEQVNELNRGIRAEGYINIIRKPFPIEETRCPDMVRTKDGWASPEGVKVDLPPPLEVPLEILETKNYSPDRVIGGDEWGSIFFDKSKDANCNALFKPADPNDPMKAGERFVKDPTGQKIVPYLRYDLHTGAKRICDQNNIWFITHLEQPNKMLVTKYTTTGNLVYRISFRNPEEVSGFTGYPVLPTIKPENGFLNFEWWHFKGIYTDWHVARTLKVRFLEPVSTGKH